jgi:hypothetical protein
MTKMLYATLFVTLAGYIAVAALPHATATATVTVASNASLPSSPDIVMPAPQEPFDTTPISAVETVGASRTE